MKPLASGVTAETRGAYDVPHSAHLEVVPDPPEDTLPNRYADVPDQLRPREYGRHAIAPVRLGNIIMLSQQRAETNSELGNLAESIEGSGLLNQPDLVRIQRGPLERYIRFTNMLWGTDNELDGFTPAEDGYFYLVAAGHSRILAITGNEQRRATQAEQAGYEVDWGDAIVLCKIHEADSPYDILAVQISENLHSKPSQERTAMGVVEMYQFGLDDGRWSSKAEFLRAMNGQYSKQLLDDAIAFKDLPKEVRQLVAIRGIKYGPAIALARSVDKYQAYCLAMFFGDVEYHELSDEKRAELDEEIWFWTNGKAAFLQRPSPATGQILNVTAAQKHFASAQNDWAQKVAKMRAEKEDASLALFDTEELVMNNASADWAKERAKTRKEYVDSAIIIGKLPMEAAQSLRVHTSVLGEDSKEFIEIDQTLRQIGRSVGRGVLTLLDAGQVSS